MKTETITLVPSSLALGPRAAAALHCVMASNVAEQRSSRHLLDDVTVVEIRRSQARTVVRNDATGTLVLGIPDPCLSSLHARIWRDIGYFVLEDCGSKNGCFRNGKRVTSAHLLDGDVLEMGHGFLVFRSRQPAGGSTPADLTSDHMEGSTSGLATLSLSLEARFADLRAAAATRMPVLITGETGCGKELAARAVHELSRRGGEFVAVNCAALPRSLVEAELFGFVRGSFSGALHDKPGLIRAADGGTLFLDEIGEMPPDAQAALLRAIQESEVLPIGATRARAVDLRIVAASNRDLEAEIAEGRFRQDLYERLAGFALELPPLRARREDLGILLAALLRRLAPARKLALSHGSARVLCARVWPGNVRELERVIQLAVMRATGDRLEIPDDRRPGADGDAADPAEATVARDLRLDDGDSELRGQLIELLQEHRGNVTRVAQALGKARGQAYRWIRRVGLELTTFRARRSSSRPKGGDLDPRLRRSSRR